MTKTGMVPSLNVLLRVPISLSKLSNPSLSDLLHRSTLTISIATAAINEHGFVPLVHIGQAPWQRRHRLNPYSFEASPRAFV